MNQLTSHHRAVGERIYGAFAAGDLDTLAAALHPAVVLDVPGRHPNAGRREGPDGFLAFVEASSAVALEELELVDLLAGERHVAGYAVVRGHRAGRAPLENRTVHLLEVDDDGLVTRIRFHNADQHAVDAFWR